MTTWSNNITVGFVNLVNNFKHSTQLVIVTGADSSHIRSLRQFLSSLYFHEPNIKVLVYDLGLTKDESTSLRKTYSSIDIRAFNFLKYPDYFNIHNNAGEYAWKPIIVDTVLNEFKCNVCWMDAGNLITEPLYWIRQNLNRRLFYSPRSQGDIVDWTHPNTLEYLQVQATTLNKFNLTAGAVAVSYTSKSARRLIRQWRDYALVKECIAPEGSDRSNHRQDQAVLSILAHQSGLLSEIPEQKHGFKTHCDLE